VVFSSEYLIITLNSVVLFLVSFFLIHFLTHLVTGIAAWFCGISTTLNYAVVDFHIRYWNWTEEAVIIVFSIPALFTLLITFFCYLAFAKRRRRRHGFLKRLRYLTKKQRYRHRRRVRQRDLERQVQRLTSQSQPREIRKPARHISWTVKLFLLWTIYHCLTYFFSGMLYSFLFHRRFGYVIWYAFNASFFDLLFSLIAFVSLIMIGYAFAVQFFYSGRLYFNDLNGRNRMPFMISQVFFPFILGTIITIALQIPKFDPALILLNFSMFFLLLPIPSRAARAENIHFDSRDKPVKINRKWVVWSTVIVLAIVIAIKIGIPIRLP